MQKTALKALTKALTKAAFINKCAFWEKAEMVKCKKNIPKGINGGRSSVREIAKVVSARNSTKGINKGKCACWEIAEMVKCKKTSLKALTNGKVPFGR